MFRNKSSLCESHGNSVTAQTDSVSDSFVNWFVCDTFSQEHAMSFFWYCFYLIACNSDSKFTELKHDSFSGAGTLSECFSIVLCSHQRKKRRCSRTKCHENHSGSVFFYLRMELVLNKNRFSISTLAMVLEFSQCGCQARLCGYDRVTGSAFLHGRNPNHEYHIFY